MATAMEKLHYVLHAPQGDTYADLLFTLNRTPRQAPARSPTPTFGARDLEGKDTAQIFQDAAREAVARFQPVRPIIVGAFVHRGTDPRMTPAACPKRWACPCPANRARTAPATSARKTGARPKPSTRSCARSPTRSIRAEPREARPVRGPNILGPTAARLPPSRR